MTEKEDQKVVSDIIAREQNQKIVSNTFLCTGLASAGYGAFHGFYDGMGISLPNKYLDAYLVFGPSIIQSILGIFDGISIAKTGRQTTGNYPLCMEETLRNIIEKADGEVMKKTLHGGLMGGVGEGITAGLETLLGYGVGYFAGRIAKLFS